MTQIVTKVSVFIVVLQQIKLINGLSFFAVNIHKKINGTNENKNPNTEKRRKLLEC